MVMSRQYGQSPVPPKIYRARWGALSLSALGTVLALLVFLTVSGPHLVHHLFELYPSDNSPSHDGAAAHFPDCLVFAVTQHIPVTTGCAVLFPVLLPVRESSPVELPFYQPTVPRYVSQARAPPRRSYCHV